MAVVELGRTYRIGPERETITCLVCGCTSHDPNDMLELFCAPCDVYHEDRELALRLERELYEAAEV